jgi:hypothetical protein
MTMNKTKWDGRSSTLQNEQAIGVKAYAERIKARRIYESVKDYGVDMSNTARWFVYDQHGVVSYHDSEREAVESMASYIAEDKEEGRQPLD